MSSFQKSILRFMKTIARPVGLVFSITAFFFLFFESILSLVGILAFDFKLAALLFGMLSVGLGLIAIDISAKADERHTDLLERLDKNVARLPALFKGDVLTPPGQLLAKDIFSKQAKTAAQKRLDEDTKRVGYVRGELFLNEDGSWSIHWGGNYPL